MPHYSWLPVFMHEFRQLSPEQQQAFLDAVRRYVIEPLLAGGRPPSSIFHKMEATTCMSFAGIEVADFEQLVACL
ncbi:MAG TPA: hypothetical protein VFS83_04065 [Ktedonobacterales bacterium]|nr:hypothetical protein [Ktedonobacterales bacterium]